MISCLLLSPDLKIRGAEAEKIIGQYELARNHPDVFWQDVEKLGIDEARAVQDFLSLKPYQGKSQAVVIVRAENLTPEAQNALLKTLEEPSEGAIIILGATLEEQLLATIVSRCQIINLNSTHLAHPINEVESSFEEIEKLLGMSVEQRFQFVEKLTNREEFLSTLTSYFRHQMLKGKGKGVNFLKDLLEAEKWAHQNVNIRAILEYLMLKIP